MFKNNNKTYSKSLELNNEILDIVSPPYGFSVKATKKTKPELSKLAIGVTFFYDKSNNASG